MWNAFADRQENESLKQSYAGRPCYTYRDILAAVADSKVSKIALPVSLSIEATVVIDRALQIIGGKGATISGDGALAALFDIRADDVSITEVATTDEVSASFTSFLAIGASVSRLNVDGCVVGRCTNLITVGSGFTLSNSMVVRTAVENGSDAISGTTSNVTILMDTTGDTKISGNLEVVSTAHIGTGSGATPNAASNLVVEGSSTNYISLLGPVSSSRGLLFGDTGSAQSGGILYDGTNLEMRVHNNTTVGTFHSGGLTLEGSSPYLSISNTAESEAGIKLYDSAASGSQYAHITYASSSANSLYFKVDSTTPLLTLHDEQKVGVNVGATLPGTVFAVGGLTGHSTHNYVRVNTTNGDFYYDSSTIRVKENVEEIDIDPEVVLQLEAKKFDMKPEHGGEKNLIGWIAEDIAEVEPRLASYDAEGLPNGYNINSIVSLLVETVKKQERRIATLEAK